MINKCLQKDAADKIFRQYGTKIRVYLPSVNSKGNSFDPRRQIGFTKKCNNPLCLSALKETLSPNSLVIRELGLRESGALKLTIESKNINFLKIAERLEINGEDYYVYNDAVGNKLQIKELSFGFTQVIVFQKQK